MLLICTLPNENRPFRLTLLLTLLACLLSLPAASQTTTGRILGTITDASGATVNDAVVTVTDVERGTVRTFTTESGGAYAALNLIPGLYKVRVEAKGFKTVERTGIQLEVASDALVDVALQPGNIVDIVTVTEEVPLINATSATLGGTLSNKEINDLPLNGRNYENLLQLRPGITRYPGGGFSTTSSNGLRAEDNVFLIDGLFNSEPYSGQNIINGAGIAGDSATILPIDAIQEFNVQVNPAAEYGWKPGTIVNVGLKSGTNTLHGTGYAFGRDTPLDARNYFNTIASGPKNPRNLEQFGGTAGGALVKDKVFFFGGYEGQRYTVGNSFGIQSPATVGLPNASNCTFIASGDCTNSLTDAIADVQAAGITVSPASLKIAGCTAAGVCDGTGFPTNGGTNPNGPTSIINGFPNTVSADNFIAKADVHLNDRNSVTGMYFYGNNNGTVEDFPELQPKWQSLIHTRAQVVGGSWTFFPNSRWVNEARFGYNRLYQPSLNKDHALDPAAAYGLNTGVPVSSLSGGLPRIGWFGEFQAVGGFKWPKLQGPDTRTQFLDHVTYTTGKHTIKFGGEVHRNGVSGGAFGNARGSVNFGGGAAFATSSALEDFFAGLPTNGSVLSGDPRRHLSDWSYAAFLQDDMRVSHTFTLNLGLRYELNTALKEEHDLIANFDPNVGLVQVGKQIKAPFQTNHANFAPRAGFAWDIGGQGKTVVRGGGGIMYENVNWQAYLAFNNSFGLTSIPTGAQIDGAAGPGSIQVGNLSIGTPSAPWDTSPIFASAGQLSCDSGAPCSILGVDQKITTPYVYNWMVSLQQAITPNLSLEVAYVGNHGKNLIGIRDINQPPVGSGWPAASIATCIASGYTDPVFCAPDSTGGEEANRPFATKFDYLGNIFQMGNVYKSNYNGLQATLTARNYHGLSMIAGYTYSHALDDVGANWDFGYGYGLPTDSSNPGREYASSDFDARHRLTLSLTYLLPGKEGYGQLLEGWQVNSIVVLTSGQPWGPIDLATDVSGTGGLPFSPPATSPNRWDFFGKTTDFKPTTSGIPYFSGASNGTCASKALALDGGSAGPATAALNLFGCYAAGNSIMIPPGLGTLGTMSRNTFRDTGFKNLDISLAKNFKWGERFGAQARLEIFNILNHPNLANPYGGQNGFGFNDPGAQPFGCACATPDVSAANPVIGSGGSRSMQIGLKLTF
jgi:hypothetical protein